MAKAIAINAVQICRAPGELSPEGKVIKLADIVTIAPGAEFEADDDTIAALVSAGHATVAPGEPSPEGKGAGKPGKGVAA